jgi:hypothetical protein
MNASILSESTHKLQTAQSFGLLFPAQNFFSDLPEDANALVAFVDFCEVTRARQNGHFSADIFHQESIPIVDMCVELGNCKVDWLADARDVAIHESFAVWARLGKVPLVLANKKQSRCFFLPFANAAANLWPQVTDNPELAIAEAGKFVDVATKLADAQLLQNLPWTPSPEPLEYVSVNTLLTKTSLEFVQPNALFQHHSTLADKLI